MVERLNDAAYRPAGPRSLDVSAAPEGFKGKVGGVGGSGGGFTEGRSLCSGALREVIHLSVRRHWCPLVSRGREGWGGRGGTWLISNNTSEMNM